MRLTRGTRVRISTAHVLHADQQRYAGQEGTIVGLFHWQGGVQYTVRFADGSTSTFYPLYIERPQARPEAAR